MSQPTGASIKKSVFMGLKINGDLTPMLVPTVTFSPTLGIAAGRIDKLGLDIRSFRDPLLRAIRLVMVPSIRRNFDEGGRPVWDPLSDYTLQIRTKNGSGNRILVRTGKLARVASQINIWDVSTTSAVIRDLPDKVWYGKVHQGGYDSGSMKALIKKHGGNIKLAAQEHSDTITLAAAGHTTLTKKFAAPIPARPFLVIQPEDEDAITEIFIEWLGERVASAWPIGESL